MLSETVPPSSLTPTPVLSPGSEKRFNWQRPKVAEIRRPRISGHKVSFSNSTKSSDQAPSRSNSSRTTSSRADSPAPTAPKPTRSTTEVWSPQSAIASSNPPSANQHSQSGQQDANCLRINRQGDALWHDESTDAPVEETHKPFAIYDDGFLEILGPSPALDVLIHDQRAPYFYDGAVWEPSTNTLFMTSNLMSDGADVPPKRSVVITKVEFYSPTAFARDKVRCPERQYMPSGATPFRGGLVFCAQGTLNEPAGLVHLAAKAPHRTTRLLTNLRGRRFNSPRAVAASPSDASLWFTDPPSAQARASRPRPQLPAHVYRFDPASGDVRVVANDLASPAGLAFAPDERTLYVSDAKDDGDEPDDDDAATCTRAATIYAYAIVRPSASHPTAPFLTQKRVFAYVDRGVPLGLACDARGNVYAACGDGVNVWNDGGVLLGKILVEEGCASFCFGKEGEMWICAEKRLLRVRLDAAVKGAIGKNGKKEGR